MEINVVFYRVDQPDAMWLDKLIAWWTAPFSCKFNSAWRYGYSHVEIYIRERGKMYSVSPRDNKVRTIKVNRLSNHWKASKAIQVTDAKEFRDSCNKYLGAKYDYLGILGFVVPAIKDSSSRYFCSELCITVLQDIGQLPKSIDASRYSPNDLASLLGVLDYE